MSYDSTSKKPCLKPLATSPANALGQNAHALTAQGNTLTPDPISTLPPALTPFTALEAAKALRDFFSATNKSDIAASVQSLGKIFNFLPEAKKIANLPDSVWQESEYAYNRLFIGPSQVPAAPYASLYLMQEPQFMGASTLDIRQFFSNLGLAVPNQGSVPDDHLAFELDAWVALCTTLHNLPEQSQAQHEVLEAFHWLISEHMNLWIPLFIHKALAQSDLTPPLYLALASLSFWLEQALTYVDRRRTLHETKTV